MKMTVFDVYNLFVYESAESAEILKSAKMPNKCVNSEQT